MASIIGYLGLLSFGLGGSYLRFYSRHLAKKKFDSIALLNGLFLLVYSVIGITSLVLGLFLVSNLSILLGNGFSVEEQKLAISLGYLSVVNMAIQFPASVFGFIVHANERFYFQKILTIVFAILNPLITLTLLGLKLGTPSILISLLITGMVINSLNVVYSIKQLNSRFTLVGFSIKHLVEIFKFSSFLFVGLVIEQINWNLDRIIIGRFVGAISVAIYSIAAQINIYFVSISSIVNNVYLPKANEIVSKGIEMKDLNTFFVKVSRIQFYFIMPVLMGIYIFGEKFIILWA